MICRRWPCSRCSSASVLAVVQTDVKRMMAYSSINHAGFVLVGVQAATEQGVQAALFYLATYTFLIAGTFGVITLVGRKGDGAPQPRRLPGPRPVAAGAGAAADRVPARPGRRAADLGLLRQVLRHHRRGRRRVGVAGGRRHAVVGHLGVPVPAHHGEPVHGRSRRGAGAPASPSRWAPASASPCAWSSRCSSACGPARSPRWPGTRSRSSPPRLTPTDRARGRVRQAM